MQSYFTSWQQPQTQQQFSYNGEIIGILDPSHFFEKSQYQNLYSEFYEEKDHRKSSNIYNNNLTKFVDDCGGQFMGFEAESDSVEGGDVSTGATNTPINSYQSNNIISGLVADSSLSSNLSIAKIKVSKQKVQSKGSGNKKVVLKLNHFVEELLDQPCNESYFNSLVNNNDLF